MIILTIIESKKKDKLSKFIVEMFVKMLYVNYLWFCMNQPGRLVNEWSDGVCYNVLMMIFDEKYRKATRIRVLMSDLEYE